MNRSLKWIIYIIGIHLIGLSPIFAQSLNKVDTVNTLSNAETFFNTAIKNQSRLFNGTLFQDYSTNIKGSANFQDLTTFSKGYVIYNGFRFDNIPLMYDIYQDNLVILLNGTSKFNLLSYYVSEFQFNGHYFKYIKVTDTTNSIIKSGFFDVIYNGKNKVLVKRTKNIQSSTDNNTLSYYFVPRTNYYLERNKQYFLITSKKTFLNYFKDKKMELNKKLKENKISFKKNPEEAMILLASYYESLSN